ncbi:MAG TPA: VOC family protein [Steroidobacteraceae bacterium]|jgi:catechol 2,3-dioxygenase-like lactoylglutathione lyase family enzyme|nr:VOC family protein [Steroidobacteraceae bacterium]
MTEESSVARGRPPFIDHPLRAIRALDYTVIFVRDLHAMRRFYTEVMQFEVYFELGDGKWLELRVGGNILALAEPGLVIPDRMPPAGTACLQLAFRVRREDVDACETALRAENVEIVAPATDQPWGHRTLFFRDPDGNLLEIYADI